MGRGYDSTPFSAWSADSGRQDDEEDDDAAEDGAHGSRSRSPRRADLQTSGQRKLPPKSKNGRRWWSHDEPERRTTSESQSFVGTVPDLCVPVEDRGRILGDRGSNVRRIVEILRGELGHQEEEHGRPPFVHFNEVDGFLDFEVELYPPFNNYASFERVEQLFRQTVLELRDAPAPAGTLHCKRPKKIQPDDWECPNRQCGNLCFARRKECPKCGAPKPQDAWSKAPRTSHNVPDRHSDQYVARPPKHTMELISTADRLPPVKEGECQVVWLVPADKRGYVLGKGGHSIVEIQRDSGAQVVVTTAAETRNVKGVPHCLIYVRGLPESTKVALPAIADRAGGLLAQDGFEPLLRAVESTLLSGPERTSTLALITSEDDVASAMLEARLLIRGAGLRSLLEVLEQWPEQFQVQRTGKGGAVATLLEVVEAPPWKASHSAAAKDERGHADKIGNADESWHADKSWNADTRWHADEKRSRHDRWQDDETWR